MELRMLFLYCAYFTTSVLGNDLQCYVCAGSDNSDCARSIVSSMSVKTCNVLQIPTLHSTLGVVKIESHSLQTVCLKATATGFNPKLVERGCGTFPSNLDPCKVLESTGFFENCNACNTERCNIDNEYIHEISTNQL